MLISLDFELMWGVRDHATRATYGANVLGERHAIPAMLKIFTEFGVRATWASVGMALAATKEELIESSPALRPTYKNPLLSSYKYFDEVGKNESIDPYYLGASLIKTIKETEGQEIGSHTFSHYYCLEPGQTVEQFAADMTAAQSIAERNGLSLKSFVFPRNQRSEEHLNILHQKGVRVFRGNEASWIHKASPGVKQPALQRIARLTDHYLNLSGQNVSLPKKHAEMIDVPASRFLRPFSRRMAPIDPLRLRRITNAMTHAAKTGQIFHLWWHPHNFGVDVQQNTAFLRQVLGHFRNLSDQFGMVSLNMGDFA
ncbi:hypothetical protein VW35_08935 [Devosia soli]|uniref:Chitooligosaccharide deacetylase n=2 Tax=Devosia soli TaxID=361041 RepID=A0A0F5LAU0_9HYPH|nr:hypothetical protein VW35_08935 [Devosia soli]